MIPWRSFLETGLANWEAEVPAFAPVGPDDLATIRYTSGTTGPPKGVAFTHAQLRWMAETMASLIPWNIRTRPNRYLSFLPMSHVVEGILGTYGPYDLPAPVDVTFLEDFRRVPATLPAVRPTVFFSVPRLYQKVWEGLGRSRIGARYQRMREGPLRGLLRPVVRRAMLRRAGLDRCAQLLAGSAPVDEELLRSFRELGVEIHVAYGLTEAPLVALNRLGRNRIGTVGELLPETQVRLADDGELLVRGPQVTAGYVDEDEQPFRDGWLLTGDLGHVTRDGWLVIDGRKKDLLKTAYGKYLQPSKIEAMLRRIPGVSEAMVVGEGRPFCAALLWVEGTATGHRRPGRIDTAVTEHEPGAVASRAGEAVGGAPERPVDRGWGAHRELQAQAPQGGGEVPRRDRAPVRGAPTAPTRVAVGVGGRLMSLRLRALEIHVPDVVARSALRRLFDATASAFGCDPEDVGGLDRRALLERYASFTTRCAERSLADHSDLDAVSRRMWAQALLSGRVAPSPARRPLPGRRDAGGPGRIPDDRHRPPGG